MSDEMASQAGSPLTQEERSVLISIEATLGCATCSWDGPPTDVIRGFLKQARELGLDWRRIHDAVRSTSRFAARLPPAHEVGPE
jgi:hypothetical protein